MIARVDGAIRFDPTACHPRIVDALERSLSLPNPDYVRAQRLGKSAARIPERLSFVRYDAHGRVVLPRGAVHLLRAEALRAGEPLRFEDARVAGVPADFASRVALRDYQVEAIDRIRRGLQGIVEVATGGGKTTIGVSSVASLARSALVIVHTHDLLQQWVETARRILKVEPGIIAAGQVAAAPFTVATVQTLAALPDAEIQALGARFGVVIVDECHRSPAAMFQRVLEHLPARYRVGLTATPDRDDGLTPLLEWTFGPRIFGIGLDKLVAAGHLQRPRARIVHTSFAFRYTGPADRPAMLDALTADAARNATTVGIAVDEARQGHTVLVLSERVAHCRALAEAIEAQGVRSACLVGHVKSAERTAILGAFREGAIAVVVASTLADEGLDVPRLSRLVLAFPSRAKGRLTQRIGRLMRPHASKRDAVVYDLVDVLVAPLLRQHRERRAAYGPLVERVETVSVGPLCRALPRDPVALDAR
jgi:superfamily II DNA or RNA helicase